MNNFAQTLVDRAVSLQLIDAEETEIYVYGLTDLLYSTLVWGVMLIASLVVGMAPFFLVFMVVYAPLRRFGGGIHMQTRAGCVVLSILLAIAVFALPVLADVIWLDRILMIAYLPCCVAIWLLCPIADPKKPLNKKQTAHFRKISRVLCLINAPVFAVLLLLHAYQFVYFAGIGVFICALQLLLAAVQQHSMPAH